MMRGKIVLANHRLEHVMERPEIERETYLKSVVAQSNTDALLPFIHITKSSEDYRVINYTLDIPDVWHMYKALNELRGNVQEMKDAGALPPHALQDVLDQAERVANTVRQNMRAWG